MVVSLMVKDDDLLLRGSGYLGYVDRNQGYNPYKWVICPLTRAINLHITSYLPYPEPLSMGSNPSKKSIHPQKKNRQIQRVQWSSWWRLDSKNHQTEKTRQNV